MKLGKHIAKKKSSATPDRFTREVKYWESAYDRLKALQIETKTTLDGWQAAHDRAVQTVHNWESWYKSLEHDRDLYKQWNEEKQSTIKRLEQLTSELAADRDRWQAEHLKVEALLRQRDSELQQSREQWTDEHAKIESVLHQRDNDVVYLRQTLEADNRKHLAQQHQWQQWLDDQKKEISRLNSLVEETRHERDNYKRLEEERHREVADLRAWIDAALLHPFWHLSQFIKHFMERIRKR